MLIVWWKAKFDPLRSNATSDWMASIGTWPAIAASCRWYTEMKNKCRSRSYCIEVNLVVYTVNHLFFIAEGGFVMTTQIIKAEFPSLHACIDYIKANYPTDSITLNAKEIDGAAEFTSTVPRFLFRGESCDLPSTVSSMQRLKHCSSWPPKVHIEIERISCEIDQQLQDFWHIGSMLSAGFCQHYGLPTELIDITAKLEVAAFFASDGTVGQKGRMAVFPSAVLGKKAIVINLTLHPFAQQFRAF